MNFFKTLKNDLPASIIVFFVALPLCLGIALASGAPPFAGIIAGIIGGIVVGALSGSALGVSGPAAGLAAVVMVAISTLGGYENFLTAVVLAGIIQIILGVLKAGIIGYYFPSSVIKGMLTGIGIIIILKQIPYFLGYDVTNSEDWILLEVQSTGVFSNIIETLNHFTPGVFLIAFIGLGILILWDNVLVKKSNVFKLIQGPLVAVAVGIIYQVAFASDPLLGVGIDHLVKVPVPEDVSSFFGQFSFPNFGSLTNPEVWIVAFTLAIIASLETLLSVEASDKIDPQKRVTPTNRELLAQGIGNIFSGMIGGLPLTQVIVRSSANVQSGAKSKLSTMIHGVLLILSVVLIPRLINLIPLSVLSSILFVVGYKLAKPKLFVSMYKAGWMQFVPFILTVLFIVFKDLLWGIGIGLSAGVLVVLIKSYQNSHFLHIVEDKVQHKIKMTLAQEVTFFNKGAILRELEAVPENSILEIDTVQTKFLDPDVIEILSDFAQKVKDKNITIHLVSANGKEENPQCYFAHFGLQPSTAH